MKKLVLVFGCLVTFCVWAEDTLSETSNVVQGVKERMSCDDVSAKMLELSEIEEPDEDIIAELQKLKSDYRRRCMKSAAGRKTAAKDKLVVETVKQESEDATVETKEEVVEQAEVSEQIEQEKTVKEQQTEKTSMLATEEEVKMFYELMNLDMGLCADGTEPNKFGCCSGEIFKDLGNEVYACCPKTGGDCFPPLK